jgi:aspartate racemase
VSRKKLKTIGVLGGMGPEATAYFLDRLVRATAARTDQDHPPVLVYSLPQVPNRTEAILHGGPSPAPHLLRGVKTLQRAGADFAVIPCITAHYFLPRLAARSPLPILDLLEETLAEIKKLRPAPAAVGLIATDGTVRSGIVSRLFEPAGISVIIPSAHDQRRLMTAIYGPAGIKAGVTEGTPRKTILQVARNLVRRGAGAVMAGCTEIPLVLRAADLPVPIIEPMAIGARAAVKRAGARLRREADS